MGEMRKITVYLPADLVEWAENESGGLTETIRKGLEAAMANDRMLALRGKVEFAMTWQEAAGKYDDAD
jgi:hypothetical protein